MIWVKNTKFLRLGDIHTHGYSNNHMVKVKGQLWSWSTVLTLGWKQETNSNLPC